MKSDAFKSWLVSTYPSTNTVNTQFSCAKRVDEALGDLDVAYDEDRLEAFIDKLSYSASDARIGRPNPTPFPITGNLVTSIGGFRSSVRCYLRFRQEESQSESDSVIELAAASIEDRREGRLFDLETHLQKELRVEIEQLESGLTIIDGGVERSVSSGDIDILAKDSGGSFVVIELKRNTAKRDAIGQILGYVGDLMDEEPDKVVRAILVAGDFDKSCVGAARAVPYLKMIRYRFRFSFEEFKREKAD